MTHGRKIKNALPKSGSKVSALNLKLYYTMTML